MNKAKEADDAVELDLTDLIADDLPPELRASYYREMRHCQSLPKNDEVLRIIRVITDTLPICCEDTRSNRNRTGKDSTGFCVCAEKSPGKSFPAER